jgi:hypothetical protein
MVQMLPWGVCDQRMTLPARFAEFLKVSVCSFGGGLVWACRSVIDQRHYIAAGVTGRRVFQGSEAYDRYR